MAWTEAYDLIQSLDASASMYINSKEEENAVYNALDELGIAGTNEIHFWLGLRQLSNLNSNNNVDEGWQWLDGRLLTEELANWSPLLMEARMVSQMTPVEQILKAILKMVQKITPNSIIGLTKPSTI